MSWNPLEWLGSLIELLTNGSSDDGKSSESNESDEEPLDEEGLMKEKVKKTGYAVVIRIITTGNEE